jgi:hypothetical protein
MLSKSTSRLLTIAVKWTSFFGGMPIEWDDRRSKIKLTKRGWRKWYFWVAFIIFNWIYYLIRYAIIQLDWNKQHHHSNSTDSKNWTNSTHVDMMNLHYRYFQKHPHQLISIGYEKLFLQVKGYQLLIFHVIIVLIYYNTFKRHLEYVCFVNGVIRFSQDFRSNSTIFKQNNCRKINKTFLIEIF